MIDEELYEQAVDELNSGRRRAHIWARACALSKNDHDEARYLYTNLRVEELLANANADSDDHANDKTSNLESYASSGDDTSSIDETLALADDFSSTRLNATAADDFASTEEATLASAEASGSASPDTALADDNDVNIEHLYADLVDDSNTMDHNATLAMDTSSDLARVSGLPLNDSSDIDSDATLNIDTLSSLTDTTNQQTNHDPSLHAIDLAALSPIEREYYEKHPEQLKELAESNLNESLRNENEELDTILQGITFSDSDEARDTSLDFSDADVTRSVVSEGEFDWFNDDDLSANADPQRSAVYSPAPDDADRFTQDLLRQADELPGEHSDLVATDELYESDDSGWEPSPRANLAAVGTAASIGASRFGQIADNSQPRQLTNMSESLRLPIDLNDGESDTEYTVFRRDQNVQAVKKGVSWSALFFTVPYLLYRHLFGTALAYIITSLIVGAGLLFMGIAWLEAGAAASNVTKLATAGFGLLAVISICYIPLRHANSWRAEKLEQRGFEVVARVKAKNPGKAIALARQASALD